MGNLMIALPNNRFEDFTTAIAGYGATLFIAILIERQRDVIMRRCWIFGRRLETELEVSELELSDMSANEILRLSNEIMRCKVRSLLKV
jgi:hypothetical protein